MNVRAWVRAFWLVGSMWLAGGGAGAHADDSVVLRRYALIVAANDGGDARPRLRHAEADARAVNKVLTELGGVQEADVQQLLEPSPDDLAAAIAAVSERVKSERAKKQRSELLFYYSGHSDEQGLLLGARQLGYRALRQLLDKVDVDVRVAILDSCASGAFTREKGGFKRAPFLFDSSTEVRGHAFLTSASEHEAAQESDRLGGSFFTHFLVSGLRGAADASGDGRVTLTEAYRFAFEETLARTGQTQLGAQHPAYDIRLAGTGDLVLTDLRSTASELQIAGDIDGRVLVIDLAGGVFLELSKPAGRIARVALPAATYTLEVRRGAALYRGKVSTQAGALRVTMNHLKLVEGEVGHARGGHYQWVPAAAALVPVYSTNRLYDARVVENGFNLSLLFDAPHAVSGAQLSFAVARTRERVRGVQLAPMLSSTDELRGVQLAFAANHAGERCYGVQLAGLNLALEQLSGVQLAFVNYARALRGVQLSGLSIVDHAEGVQLGMLNVARGRVHGLQLGLLNYAGEADVQLGALSVTKEGGAHVVMSTSDVALLSWALTLNAKYNYSFLAVGYQPAGRDDRRGYSVGLGLGAKLPLLGQLLWLDIDLGWHVLQPRKHWRRGVPNSLAQLRAMVRVQLHRHLSVFAGPTLNVLVQLDADERVRLGWGVRSHRIGSGDEERISWWPGVVAGLRF